jgi:hypothetical protein
LEYKIKQEKDASTIFNGLDLLYVGFDSYQEAVNLAGGNPYTTLAATVFLFGYNLLLSDEPGPGYSTYYESSVFKNNADRAISNALREFLDVYNSPLRYVVAPGQPLIAREASQIAIFTEIDRLYRFERLGNITKETRVTAVNYLETILKCAYDSKALDDYLRNL